MAYVCTEWYKKAWYILRSWQRSILSCIYSDSFDVGQ